MSEPTELRRFQQRLRAEMRLLEHEAVEITSLQHWGTAPAPTAPQPEGEELPNDWAALVAEATASGRSIVQIQICTLPVTAEMAAKLHAVAAAGAPGEKFLAMTAVEFAARSNGWDPHVEIWLFDNRFAVLSTFDAAGQLEREQETFDADVLLPLRALVDGCLQAAIPVPEFLRAHGVPIDLP